MNLIDEAFRNGIKHNGCLYVDDGMYQQIRECHKGPPACHFRVAQIVKDWELGSWSNSITAPQSESYNLRPVSDMPWLRLQDGL